VIDRIKVLTDLVSFSEPLNILSNELAELDWEYEGEPFVIRAMKIIEVLQRYISGKIKSMEIEEWANLIECREDLEFEEDKRDMLENTIYRLANPVLEGAITPEICRKLIITLF
jgi:hypothetical protein